MKRTLTLISFLVLTLGTLQARETPEQQLAQTTNIFGRGLSGIPGIKVARARNLTTSVQLQASNGGNQVDAIISIQPDQLNSIVSRGGYVNVELYLGSQRWGRTYELRQPRQSFSLPSNAVCSQAAWSGSVTVTVHTSVIGTDRDYTDGNASATFTCASRGDDSGSDRSESLDANVRFNIGGGQVNAVIEVNSRQFDIVNRYGGYVEIRLYAGDQRGQERRLDRRTYEMRSNRASYTFPPADVCDRDAVFSYDRYVKVWASARRGNGDPVPGLEARERHYHVVCKGALWNIWNDL